jgi:hypothetical protein
MSVKPKCIIILSTKSSGSSALQELLCDFGGGRHVQHTRHREFETLYWTKAASVLGLPQTRLPDSEVPIAHDKALRDLRDLLDRNISNFKPPREVEELIFVGWHALCVAHAPIYVEKSPHHLHQWSCLQLMIDAMTRLEDIEFRFVGLVRNPMDVLYSAWSRWRQLPERFQQQWAAAYENLERFQTIVGERLIVVKYEELSSSKDGATRLMEKLGMEPTRRGANDYIHSGSHRRWVADHAFGFQLDSKVTRVAERFGYISQELTQSRDYLWPIRRVIARAHFRWIRTPYLKARRLARETLKRQMA